MPLLNSKNQELTRDNISDIANKMMAHLEGLNKPAIENVLGWLTASLDDNYFLSIIPPQNKTGFIGIDEASKEFRTPQ